MIRITLKPNNLKNIVCNWITTNTSGSTQIRTYQIDVIVRILKLLMQKRGAELALMTPRQTGKTTLISHLNHICTCLLPTLPEYSNGFQIGIFAPTKIQAAITFERTRLLFDSYFTKEILGISTIEDQQYSLKLDNGSGIIVRSANKIAKIEGPSLNLALIEEAQDVPDIRINKTIYPMTAETGGVKVLIGTATPEAQGYFHEFTTQQRDKTMIIEPEEVFPYSPTWKQWYEREEKRLGKTHPIFLTQYRNKWVVPTDIFIKIDKLTALRQANILEQYYDSPCYVGADVAKVVDATVIVPIVKCPTNPDKMQICNWLEMRGVDYREQVEHIKRFLNNYDVRIIFMDTRQAGEALADMLEDDFEIERLKIGEKQRSEMYTELEIAMLQGELLYPKEETEERVMFETQFYYLRKYYKGSYVHVNKAVDRRNPGDDYPDATAMAWWAYRSDLGLEGTEPKDLIGSGTIKNID